MLTTDLGVTVLTDDAPRSEIIEALTVCARDASRTPTRDGLSRLNNEWTVRHKFLDHLLGMLERCDG